MVERNPYDELLYSGFPYAQTHPDRLATNAILFGMTPQPVTSCRVLELACGDGSNLIPMALGLPGSEFLGIDLAARPIAKGMSLIETLGLTNIRLWQSDVVELTKELGQFDYIIAHGLYSWVPAEVQEKILEICKNLLAPQGVAYISYNTLPGGHLRHMVREMMLFHARGVTDPQERIEKARELIKFLSETPSASNDYALFLKKQLEFISNRADEALFHDDLAEINKPLYFYHFIAHAARWGLQYISEAELMECQAGFHGPLISGSWQQLGHDLIAQEQYFDFLKCRMFRQTLLCHDNVPLDRSLNREKAQQFYVACSAQPVSPSPDVASPGVVEQFRVSSGAGISIDFPLAKAALVRLGEIWPQSASFDELLHYGHAIVGDDRAGESARGEKTLGLCEFLLKTCGTGLVELHTYQPAVVGRASQRPVVSPLVRLQLREGPFITTLGHATIKVEDDMARHLISLLDGSRDRPMLLRELNEMLKMTAETSSARAQQVTEITPNDLEQKLQEVGRLSLLVG
jgi:SAM-dependent methyltransferase